MWDLVTFLTAIGTVLGAISFAGNLWQAHRARVRDAKFDTRFKELIPAWHEWAESIRRIASSVEYDPAIEEPGAAKVAIMACQETASSLSDSLEMVADTYLSDDELAAKKERRRQIAEDVRQRTANPEGTSSNDD